VRWRRYWRA